MDEKSKPGKHIIRIAINSTIVAIMMVIGVIFLINILTVKETYTSANNTVTNINSLYCRATNLEKSYFDVTGTKSALHEIKVTFEEEKTNLISYTFTGTYNSEEDAKTHRDTMLAKLWKYLGANGFKHDYLKDDFSIIDNILRVNVIGNKDTLNSTTASVFSLETSEATRFNNQTIDSLKKIYGAKGFECKINK